MHGKLRLYRVFAKHRAAGYVGNVRRKRSMKERKRLGACMILFAALVVLYFGELPLLRFRGNVPMLLKLVKKENKEAVGEEGVFSVQYASPFGAYLAVSQAKGVIPAYVPPEKEPQEAESARVSVKEIVEERFGTLEDAAFQSFFGELLY